MSNLKTPFRYDYVGSFLRPAKLKKARADYEDGTISAEQLKSVEDECIIQLVNKIKGLGYHVITDGEFRRATWHLDFMWGFQGIEHKKTVDGNTTFDAEAAMIDDTYMVGKISVKNHPFVEHFKFVKALEDENTVAKQTIPSPGQFYAYFTGTQLLEDTLKIYGISFTTQERGISAFPAPTKIGTIFRTTLHTRYSTSRASLSIRRRILQCDATVIRRRDCCAKRIRQ